MTSILHLSRWGAKHGRYSEQQLKRALTMLKPSAYISDVALAEVTSVLIAFSWIGLNVSAASDRVVSAMAQHKSAIKAVDGTSVDSVASILCAEAMSLEESDLEENDRELNGWSRDNFITIGALSAFILIMALALIFI